MRRRSPNIERLSGQEAPDPLAAGADRASRRRRAWRAACPRRRARRSRPRRGARATARPRASATGSARRSPRGPSSEREGDSLEARLSRIEARIGEGDLEAALAEAEALPEAPAAAMAGWIDALASGSRPRPRSAGFSATTAAPDKHQHKGTTACLASLLRLLVFLAWWSAAPGGSPNCSRSRAGCRSGLAGRGDLPHPGRGGGGAGGGVPRALSRAAADRAADRLPALPDRRRDRALASPSSAGARSAASTRSPGAGPRSRRAMPSRHGKRRRRRSACSTGRI